MQVAAEIADVQMPQLDGDRAAQDPGVFGVRAWRDVDLQP